MISIGTLSVVTYTMSYLFGNEISKYVSGILFLTFIFNKLYQNREEFNKYYNLAFMIRDIKFRYKDNLVNDAEVIGDCLKINYRYMGSNYNVFVPFGRKFTRKIECKEVFVRGSDSDILVTQQPGIPLLIYPAMLGGNQFVIFDESGDEIVIDGERELLEC